MGNNRFKLSNIMPNAWLYKLRNMGKATNKSSPKSNKKQPTLPTTRTSQKLYFSEPRYSYNLITEPNRAVKLRNSPVNPKASDTHFPEPPIKTSKRKAKRKSMYEPSSSLVSTSVSAGCSCRTTLSSVRTKHDPLCPNNYFFSSNKSSGEPVLHKSLQPESEFGSNSFNGEATWEASCSCRVSSSTADIIIDMKNTTFQKKVEKLDKFDTISEPQLPPILTKPGNKFNELTQKETAKLSIAPSKLEELKDQGYLCVTFVKEGGMGKVHKEPKANYVSRKSFVSSTGVKLRWNSPRIASRKIRAYGRKSISSSATRLKSRTKNFTESYAVVKSSLDPQRDFRKSMVEMIVENNIRASKDLEELLACYLTLNSGEHHNLIVKAFEQIWFDIGDISM